MNINMNLKINNDYTIHHIVEKIVNHSGFPAIMCEIDDSLTSSYIKFFESNEHMYNYIIDISKNTENIYINGDETFAFDKYNDSFVCYIKSNVIPIKKLLKSKNIIKPMKKSKYRDNEDNYLPVLKLMCNFDNIILFDTVISFHDLASKLWYQHQTHVIALVSANNRIVLEICDQDNTDPQMFTYSMTGGVDTANIHLIHDYILADEHMGNSVFTFHIFGLCDHFLNKLSEINQPNLFSFPFSKQQWFDFLNYGKRR